MLGGATAPTRATIDIDGRAVAIFDSPHDRRGRRRGHLPGVQPRARPDRRARTSSWAGSATRLGFVARRASAAGPRSCSRRLGVAIDPDAPCRRSTIAQQQMVEIAKALAARGPHHRHGRADRRADRRTRSTGCSASSATCSAQGIGHHLHQPPAGRDLRHRRPRDGPARRRHVGDRADRPRSTREELIELMVGRELKDEFPDARSRRSARRGWKSSGLRARRAVRDVSLRRSAAARSSA